MLEHVAGGWAFRSAREAAEACARLFEKPAQRNLSQASLETLAIVAYLGPCSRPDIASHPRRRRRLCGREPRRARADHGVGPRRAPPAARSATARRRSSSGSSGSRASRSCRASTTSAPTRSRSASGCTRSPRSARRRATMRGPDASGRPRSRRGVGAERGELDRLGARRRARQLLAFQPRPLPRARAAAARRVLDLGCGEGRFSRDLKALGYDVVGIDCSPTLVAAAREADPSLEVHEADAAALPVR